MAHNSVPIYAIPSFRQGLVESSAREGKASLLELLSLRGLDGPFGSTQVHILVTGYSFLSHSHYDCLDQSVRFEPNDESGRNDPVSRARASQLLAGNSPKGHGKEAVHRQRAVDSPSVDHRQSDPLRV